MDKARIHVKAGDGGDGAVSFHTEKYVPNGGPDGGDGGRGGHVSFVARTGMSTLQVFRYRKKFKAVPGEKGGRRKQYGRSGADLTLEVPVGTVIKDIETDRIVADLTEADQEIVIARGGRGGKGNVHFANSVRQAPRFARIGEAGEEYELLVELKLIADVGLIGFPNVGKSSLLAAASSARPKIADYPFTTVQPGLGVVTLGDTSFVMADIPGLVAGAHTGAGLGLSFLRHIERTRLLVHVLDLSPETGRDPLQDFVQINEELAGYAAELARRPQIVALNKIDLAEEETVARISQTLQGQGLSVFPICAPIGEGVPKLIRAVAEAVEKLPPIRLYDPEAEQVIYRFAEEKLFEIRREDNRFLVTGTWIENLVRTTDFDRYDSLQYFQRLIRRKGVIDALEQAGIKEGDIVALHDFEFEYYP